jgi:amidase
VVDAVHKTAALLESEGHQVELIDGAQDGVPASFADDFILYWAFLAAALTFGGKKLVDPSFDAKGLTPFTRGLANHARRNALRIPGAVRRLKAAQHHYDAYMGARDIIVSPTVSDPAPTLEHLGRDVDYDSHIHRLAQWAAYTPLHNAVGAPAITLPLGFDSDAGVPVGVQLAARTGQERLLLEVALQLEAAAPFVHMDSAG